MALTPMANAANAAEALVGVEAGAGGGTEGAQLEREGC
jgi:hypothetical protein